MRIYGVNMKNSARLTSGFVTGLATLVTLVDPMPKVFSKGNVTVGGALRSDFERIGIDMFKAVESEKNSEKATS